jgi:hypothetical protein
MKNIENLMRKFCKEKNNWLLLWREGLHKIKIYYFIINLMYFIMFLIEIKK